MATPVAGFNVNKQNINRKGAPKRKWTWSGILEEAVAKKNKEGIPFKEAIALGLIEEAMRGNVIATKELFNRMDGMPKVDLDLSGEISHIIVTRGE